MAFQPLHVASFGGGLNVAGNPAAIRDDQWTWSDGWWARDGCAEILPRFVKVATGANWVTPTYQPIGIVANPFSYDNAVLIGSAGGAGAAVKVTKMEPNGTATDVPWDAVGTAAVGDKTWGVMMGGFLNGFLVLSFGAGSGTTSSLIKLANDGGYSAIVPTTTLRGLMFTTFAGHAICAGTAKTAAGVRTVLISAVNDPTTWLTGTASIDIGNDSDQVLFDDLDSGITGIGVLDSTALGLWTQRGMNVLSPTGGIPPFTRQFALGTGCWPGFADLPTTLAHSQLGATPLGTVLRGADDFYLDQTPIGQGIFEYLRAAESASANLLQYFPQYVWHATRGYLSIPLQTNATVLLMYDPHRQVWMRRTVATIGNNCRHAFALDNNSGSTVYLYGREWIVDGNGGDVYVDDIDGTAQAGAFVDTKDFTFGDPTAGDYVARLHIEWEPLTNATTDALDVLAYVHDDPSKGILGSPGLLTDFSANFVAVGTLMGGASELACRLSGKYVRLRFKQNSGRVRIRGFSLLHQRGSAKAA